MTPMMRVLFYDDVLDGLPIDDSIFLAGPTARRGRTAWRIEALKLLEARDFAGTVFIPEFSDGRFDDRAQPRFGSPPSPVQGMRATSFNILVWETAGIETATAVLFWMPFALGDDAHDPASLPGFTTRAEVSRELVRSPWRLALGMSPDALSGAHIRYHAYRAGVRVAATLAETVDTAIALVERK